MDQEKVAHIYNGILLNHKKDWYWSFVEMWLDPARVCHTDCSKSEGGKQSYINTYIWNLCRFICMLGPPTSPSWNYSRDTNPPLISPAPKCPLYNSPLQVWACSTWHMISWQQSALTWPQTWVIICKTADGYFLWISECLLRKKPWCNFWFDCVLES